MTLGIFKSTGTIKKVTNQFHIICFSERVRSHNDSEISSREQFLPHRLLHPKSQPQNIMLSSTNSGTGTFLNIYINKLFMMEI
jgi:hypothetical protein